MGAAPNYNVLGYTADSALNQAGIKPLPFADDISRSNVMPVKVRL